MYNNKKKNPLLTVAINYAIFARNTIQANINGLNMSKIEFEKVTPDKESSFKAAVYESTYFTSPLHVHPEYELVIILEGDGLCFCGDYAGPIKPGDILLFGKGLPHFCLSDKRYYAPGCREKCKSIYIQFREEILPSDYKQMPGFKAIQHILYVSERGLHFSSSKDMELKQLIAGLPKKTGFEKVMDLYAILHGVGMQESYQLMASLTYETPQISKNPFFLKTLDYVHHQYQSEISLTRLAGNVAMNKSALCRYFKKITGKSIFDYIIEFRISYACKLIANTDLRISIVAYDSGFKNISHFNSQFKLATGYSPSQYRQLFRTNT
jgi:AraC-like DNA-binding protein/mannose-6-phosphate isomerase-like protein (cupin superfamily)